jgi:transcriptional regulator with XRE-family HTH domain
MAMSDVGKALKWMRNHLDWPQKQLAAEAGITKAMICAYEKGRQSPKLETLGKILEAFDATLCDLHCAIEMVNGRQPVGHEISPQFRSRPATPPRSAARKAAESSADRPLPGDPAGAAEGEPQIPEVVESALTKVLAGVGTIARYWLVLAAKPR